jgi:hyperosmotically inducible periplasmic protein
MHKDVGNNIQLVLHPCDSREGEHNSDKIKAPRFEKQYKKRIAMKKFFLGVFGIIAVGGVLWYFTVGRSTPAVQQVEERAEMQVEQAMDSANTAVEKTMQTFDAKLEALDLKAEDIRKEMAEQGKVLRRRVSDIGESVTDAAIDARATAFIKAKLAADKELSALMISVSTTAGRVILSGKVASPELIGKAIVLALDTEGVNEVISTIQVS